MKAITQTAFSFSHQTGKYEGKVRDVYTIDDRYIAMIATDRISAFDVILPKGIPYKGQVLNQIASMFLDATADIVQNWKIASPDPMVTVGYKCQGLPIEMIGGHTRTEPARSAAFPSPTACASTRSSSIPSSPRPPRPR